MTQRSQYFVLEGGLDLVTPALKIKPGRIISGMNYEPTAKGYHRVDGYERLDGRPKPSEASYWVLNFDAGTAGFLEGETVTGGTSGATGVVLFDAVVESGSYGGGDAAGYVVLTGVSGDFADNEAITSASGAATADGEDVEKGAANDTDHNSWLQDAIETARSNIQAVPGSGPVRGVWDYKGDRYAFRDNAGGTAGVMYKATASGWQAQSLGQELSFTFGSAEFTPGETLTGGDSGATATIERVIRDSGSWLESWPSIGNTLSVPWDRSAIASLTDSEIILKNENASVQKYKFVENDWITVGNPYTTFTVSPNALGMAALTTTDVACADGTNDELFTLRFDGTDWNVLGNKLSLTMGFTSCAALNDTDVVIFDAIIGGLATYRFDGTDWSQVGNTLAISGLAAGCGVAALDEDTVVIVNGSGGLEQIRAYEFDGSDWSQVGNSKTVPGLDTQTRPTITAMTSGQVAVFTYAKVLSYTFDGADFKQISQALDFSSSASGGVLAAMDDTDLAIMDNSGRLGMYSFSLESDSAAGRLILSNIVGTFQDEELITDPEGGTAFAEGTVSAITLPPGGRYHFDNYNFFGTFGDKRMYGVNGVGYGFEWDGSIFVPIRTGMASDTPTRVQGHRNHLFFAFPGGSVQHSSIGNPYEWSVITGAGEIGIGDDVTDMLASVSGVLALFARNKVAALFGSDAASWDLRTLSDDSGVEAWTAQMIGIPVYLGLRGVGSMETTEQFGDFILGTLTQLVEPIFEAKRKAGRTPAGSLRVRSKDQYRILWDDGTGLTLYFGRRPVECMTFDLDVNVACTASVKDDSGQEWLLMGSDDGFVYEIDAGTSFDGSEVEAFARLAFNHVGSPAQNKRWMKGTIEFDGGPITELGVAAEYAYASPDLVPGQSHTYSIGSNGGFWNEMDWDNFYWSGPVVGEVETHLEGIGQNLSLLVVSNATYEQPHTLTGVTLNFSYRGVRR